MIRKRWTSAFILYFSWLHLHCSASTSENFFLRLKREANFVEAEVGNANEFFDDFFDKNKHFIDHWGLEPLNLGTVDACSDCVLTGLSTIHRTQGQNSTIKIELNGDIIVDVVVGFTRLDGHCSCAKKVWFLYARGDASLEVRDLDVRLVIRVKVSPDADAATRTKLDYFEVQHLGKLSLGWNGRGFLGTIFQWLFGLFRWKVEQKAQEIMPGVIRSFIVHMLEQLAKSKQL